MKTFGKFLVLSLLFVCAMTIAKTLGHEAANQTTMMAGFTVVNAPLLNQQAEKELIKKFRHDNTWLQELTSKNNWVGMDVIKIPRQGAAPDVLINNTTYPIDGEQRDDDYITLSLNKYDTTNTIVTADELYALPYEKVSDVQTQHREELEDVTAQHALHSLSPNANSATTPVLATTGEDDGTGRLKLTSADVIRLKKSMDKLNVPKKGRVLVLCTDHVADLLEEDRNFKTQYQNAVDGTLSNNYYGFKIYESNYTPTYDGTSTKVAFGAADGAKVASICFHNKYAVKATGSVKRFMRTEDQDPEFRQNTIGFRLWFIAVGIKDEGIGAIIG